MSLDAVADSKSVADLANYTQQIIQQVLTTGRPVVVTGQGQPDVVLVEAATFERCLRTANLAKLLADGEADVRAGRVRPIEDFLSELERDDKLPG